MSNVRITDYDSLLLKVNVGYDSIFFIEKASTSVSGSDGNLILDVDQTRYTYAFSDIKAPSKNTLDAVVVAIREYIDNV